jgi:hypothetical protein
MKSTIKKEMHINNVQFSLLEASEDFMATVLLIPSGLVTDRVGGAGELHLHNLFAEEVMRANAVRLKK